MNAFELNRKLLFYGYEEVTDFLKNSPLNRYLYKQFLDIIPKFKVDMPVVLLFNEIYFQCIRVNYDSTPGMDVKSRYLVDEADYLDSRVGANLVFAVVWALLSSKRNQTFHEECFISQLFPLNY